MAEIEEGRNVLTCPKMGEGRKKKSKFFWAINVLAKTRERDRKSAPR